VPFYCFFDLFNDLILYQAEPGTYQRAEYTSAWLQGPLLPYQILSEFPCPMHSLLVEAALVLLEESNIQCCSFFFHNCDSPAVWKYILGTRQQNVSFLSSNLRPVQKFYSHYICECSELELMISFGAGLFDRYKQQDLFNVLGAMYASTIFLGVSNSSTVQPVVGVQRTVFYREKAAGMYSAIPYAVAQVYIYYFLCS
jgi:hypothetical protein